LNRLRPGPTRLPTTLPHRPPSRPSVAAIAPGRSCSSAASTSVC
jgi:hypothetical protein